MTNAERVAAFVKKAAASVEAARQMLTGGHPDFAASRAYYAMFYAAEAALLHRGKEFRKHSAVIASFNREFVKPGIFPTPMSKTIQDAFDLRTDGDYDVLPIDASDTEHVIAHADEFVAAVREYLRREGYELGEA